MGQFQCGTRDMGDGPNTQVTKGDFQMQYVIGKGGFGKVWKVEKKKEKRAYALKEMHKAKILSKRSVTSVMNEKKLLSQLHHPFLVNMIYAFQDREYLYLTMDLLIGGDIRYHLGRKKKFPERQAKYLHLQGIIHRDIKPENLIMEANGYVRITDMGIARIWSPENAHDTSGTPGYMAPEVMCRQNHGISVDYFALGVLAYEFMIGKRPYIGKCRKDIRDNILAKQIQIKKSDIPPGWSLEAADFINKCLQRKPVNRLGLKGPSEVKQHVWLKDFDWAMLLEKKIQAPVIPDGKADNFDSKYLAHSNSKDESMRQSALLLRRPSVQNMFAGYYYNFDTIKPEEIKKKELEKKKLPFLH